MGYVMCVRSRTGHNNARFTIYARFMGALMEPAKHDIADGVGTCNRVRLAMHKITKISATNQQINILCTIWLLMSNHTHLSRINTARGTHSRRSRHVYWRTCNFEFSGVCLRVRMANRLLLLALLSLLRLWVGGGGGHCRVAAHGPRTSGSPSSSRMAADIVYI